MELPQSGPIRVSAPVEVAFVAVAQLLAYGWWLLFEPVGWVEYRLIGFISVSILLLVGGVLRILHDPTRKGLAATWILVGSIGTITTGVMVWFGGR